MNAAAARAFARLPWVLRRHLQIDPQTGCWLWTGPRSLGSNRRPKCHIWIAGQRVTLPYRATLLLLVGAPLPGFEAVHKCGGRHGEAMLCCRPHPAHVWWGLRAENNADVRRAGTFAGQRNPAARLTAAQVTAIRERYALPDAPPRKYLAARLGVCPYTICAIVRGETWQDRRAA